MNRSERQFRDAFERLKAGKPIHLPKGTAVSQNKVAEEAGLDPSALKKSRLPALVAEIQQWVDAHGDDQPKPSSSRSTASQRRRNRDLRELLSTVTKERDKAMATLVDAEAHILQLTIEIERLTSLLPPSGTTPLRLPAGGRKGSLHPVPKGGS